MDRSGSSASTLLGEVLTGCGDRPSPSPRPTALYRDTRIEKQKVTTTDSTGHSVEREELKEVPLRGAGAARQDRRQRQLAMEQRQKGLLWFPTYTRWTSRPATRSPIPILTARSEVRLPLDQQNAVY